jgi:hypothetical protein
MVAAERVTPFFCISSTTLLYRYGVVWLSSTTRRADQPAWGSSFCLVSPRSTVRHLCRSTRPVISILVASVPLFAFASSSSSSSSPSSYSSSSPPAPPPLLFDLPVVPGLARGAGLASPRLRLYAASFRTTVAPVPAADDALNSSRSCHSATQAVPPRSVVRPACVALCCSASCSTLPGHSSCLAYARFGTRAGYARCTYASTKLYNPCRLCCRTFFSISSPASSANAFRTDEGSFPDRAVRPGMLFHTCSTNSWPMNGQLLPTRQGHQASTQTHGDHKHTYTSNFKRSHLSLNATREKQLCARRDHAFTRSPDASSRSTGTVDSSVGSTAPSKFRLDRRPMSSWYAIARWSSADASHISVDTS